jgi:hypothetical protein
MVAIPKIAIAAPKIARMLSFSPLKAEMGNINKGAVLVQS